MATQRFIESYKLLNWKPYDQDATGFFDLATFLARIQLAVNQHWQVLFYWPASQPLFPQPVVVVVAQGQDPALCLSEPHTIVLEPLIQPVQIPVQDLPLLQQMNIPAQLGDICKLTKGACDPLIQSIGKNIKQGWPQSWVLGTQLVTGH